MSIGSFAGGEAALAEQAPTSAKAKVPRKRQMIAKADIVGEPEAR